ncbi:MAG: hypothetical protein M0004_17490 [Actinomycetota bacterium]|nr:hypothetical protein [Actinomycetota bacterium]
MSRRRRPRASDLEQLRAELDAKYVRVPRWNGLSPGDVVRVRGERGARFVFRCHVTNRANDARWVELDELATAGSDEGAQHVIRRQRALPEERVVALARPRRRRARTPQGEQGRLDLGIAELGAPEA